MSFFRRPALHRTQFFVTDLHAGRSGPDVSDHLQRIRRMPTVQIANFTSLTATPLNFNNFNRIFDWKDDFSKIMGITISRPGF
jgi:hypothetical protein